MNNLSGLLFLNATRFGSYVSIRPVAEAIGALLSSLGDDRSRFRWLQWGSKPRPDSLTARFHNGRILEHQRRAAMKDPLIWAGVLSAAALALREMRLMMVEIRRWFRPPPPRKPRQNKEPSA
jgi:hypothetical protein